jgi:hypothetical protein
VFGGVCHGRLGSVSAGLLDAEGRLTCCCNITEVMCHCRVVDKSVCNHDGNDKGGEVRLEPQGGQSS